MDISLYFNEIQNISKLNNLEISTILKTFKIYNVKYIDIDYPDLESNLSTIISSNFKIKRVIITINPLKQEDLTEILCNIDKVATLKIKEIVIKFKDNNENLDFSYAYKKLRRIVKYAMVLNISVSTFDNDSLLTSNENFLKLLKQVKGLKVILSKLSDIDIDSISGFTNYNLSEEYDKDFVLILSDCYNLLDCENKILSLIGLEK